MNFNAFKNTDFVESTNTRNICLMLSTIYKQYKNVLKIVLIIVYINKDENKSLISNQFSLKNDSPPPPTLLGEIFRGGKN